MMSCEEYAQLFNLYLDKELSGEDVRLLEAHLAECQDCFGHVEFDKTLRHLMKGASLKEGLSNKIKFEIQAKLRSSGLFSLFYVLGTFFLSQTLAMV